MALKTPALGF